MSELNDPEVFQSVLQSLQAGVYLVERNRRIRFWNDGAERITGYLNQDVVGRFLRDHLLVTANDTKDVDSNPADPINLVFRDGKPSITDVSILHKDGYRVPIVLRTIPIRDNHGKVVGGYFKDPAGSARKIGTDMQGAGESFAITKDNMSVLKQELQKSVRRASDFDKIKNHIDMTVTSEGLRIELMESATTTFFGSGSTEPNADGQEILNLLAQQLGSLPNKIPIEGHTDSKPYTKAGNYGNWELSSDRANAARRLMQLHGIHEDQVMQVRGFADQHLRKKDVPLDPSNLRVSLIVQYLNKSDSDKPEPRRGAGRRETRGGRAGKSGTRRALAGVEFAREIQN